MQLLGDVFDRQLEGAADGAHHQLAAVLGLGQHGSKLDGLAHQGHQGAEPSAAAEVVKVRGNEEAQIGLHQRVDLRLDFGKGRAGVGHLCGGLHHVAVGAAEGAGVDDLDLVIADIAHSGHSGGVGAAQTVGHGQVEHFRVAAALVHGDHVAQGRLAGGGHVALTDDADELVQLNLVQLLVGLAGDGDGQGGHLKPSLAGLGGGVHGGGVSNDANHGDLPSKSRMRDV